MKIQKFKTYELRLMPNYLDMPNNAVELFASVVSDKPVKIEKYLSYILIDGKIDFMLFGYQIKKYIQNCITGFYGTSEGYFISNDSITEYYATNDKSFITIDKDYYDEHKDEEELKVFTDIHYYEGINLFNIKGKYGLTFKTREKAGFLEIYNLGLLEIDPLYKDGDDKSKITSLYNDVKKLEEYKEEYIEDMIKWGKENGFNYIFGEEGRKYFNNKMFNKST